jgi:hypothetical protein
VASRDNNARRTAAGEMPIEDAVREAEGSGLGSLLCCIPSQLAYYVGESGEQRLLLRRNAR